MLLQLLTCFAHSSSLLGRALIPILLSATSVNAQSIVDSIPLYDQSIKSKAPLNVLPLYIQASVYSNNVTTVIDTGFGLTTFDDSMGHLLGPAIATYRLQGRTATGTGHGALEILLASHQKVSLDRVGALDLEHLRTIAGKNVYGIIGCDTLSRLALSFSREARCATVYSDWSPPKGHHLVSVSMVRHPHKGYPVILCKINDRNHVFAIDTGCSNQCVLSTDLFRECATDVQRGMKRVMTIDGPKFLDIGRIRSLGIRDVEWGDVPVLNAKDNLLGLPFLISVNAVLDFPNGRFYFEKPADGSEP